MRHYIKSTILSISNLRNVCGIGLRFVKIKKLGQHEHWEIIRNVEFKELYMCEVRRRIERG